MKFKVGDKVRLSNKGIREWVQMDKNYVSTILAIIQTERFRCESDQGRRRCIFKNAG